MARSVLGRTRQRIAIAAARLDFWSIRSPLADGQRALAARPLYELRALPRSELRRELSRVIPTFTGVRDFSNLVLEWRRGGMNQFAVEGEGEESKALVARAFLRRRYGDPPLRYFNVGGPDDLDDLFRAVAWELMVEGSTALLVFWHDSEELPAPAKLPQFLVPHRSSLRRRPGRAGGYTVEVLKSWPGGEVEEKTIVEEDVVQFRWPLAGIAEVGVSPVDRVIRSHLRWNELNDMALAVVRSQVETADLSLRTERARWTGLSRINEELSSVDLALSAELLQAVVGRPMTRFFDVYQVLRLYHRRAVVREYLLDRFNCFVERFSEVAQPAAEPCRLALVGYPTAGEIEVAIQRFAAKEIDGDEAVRMSAPQKLE